MALLNQNASSGDKFIVSTGNSTLGYNDITKRVNTHTHDGGDTPPVDKRDEVENQMVMLDYAHRNALAAPYQQRSPRKMTVDMVNSAGTGNVTGKLVATLNVDNTTSSTNAGVGSTSIWVPLTMQTKTNVASDAFGDTNNWRITITSNGFFTAGGGFVAIGSQGVGTVRATYSAANFNVNNGTMMEFNIQNKSTQGGGGMTWYHYVTRSNDSVTMARFYLNDGDNGDEIRMQIGESGDEARVTYAVNDTLAMRLSQVNASNLFVEFIKNNNNILYAGYASNGSTVNTFDYNMSLAKTTAGNDSTVWDNFAVNRAAGYQEGYATFTTNNSTAAEVTNINRVYGVGWPYLVGPSSNILQSFNYSASSDNGATWTTGTDVAWNTLTSTTGKQLVFRISTGNNSSLTLKSAAFAWANSST